MPKHSIADKLRRVDTIPEKEIKRTPPKNYFLNLEKLIYKRTVIILF